MAARVVAVVVVFVVATVIVEVKLKNSLMLLVVVRASADHIRKCSTIPLDFAEAFVQNVGSAC